MSKDFSWTDRLYIALLKLPEYQGKSDLALEVWNSKKNEIVSFSDYTKEHSQASAEEVLNKWQEKQLHEKNRFVAFSAAYKIENPQASESQVIERWKNSSIIDPGFNMRHLFTEKTLGGRSRKSRRKSRKRKRKRRTRSR
jgi:hypothetical protein